MADQGSWISLERAVATVHATIGGAPGPVYQTLISICAQGRVRARWTSHFSQTQPAIHKRDWMGADIDWTTPSGRIVRADGNGMAGVDFSEDDLREWAADREIVATPAIAVSPKRHLRFTLDDALVTEGMAGLRSSPPRWANLHQAATELATRSAEGNATTASKVRRIEGKISKALETSRNISRD